MLEINGRSLEPFEPGRVFQQPLLDVDEFIAKRLFAVCKDSAPRMWTVGAVGDAKKLQHKYAVNGIAVSPGGKGVATIDDGRSVNLWDLASGTEKASAELEAMPVISPDGGRRNATQFVVALSASDLGATLAKI